jgi:hypothetical protein
VKIAADHDVDTAEQIIGFVCGALLGLAVALAVVLRAGPFQPPSAC